MAKITGYTTYQTNPGDTFDIIAFKQYKNEFLASEIIQANLLYTDVLVFEDSVKLRLPIFDTTVVPETLPPWRR